MKFIVIDSAPLGLLTHRPGAVEADACRHWLAQKTSQGLRAIVPEIVDYELRRELIRGNKIASIQRLDQFNSHSSVQFLAITTAAMKLAAELWAKARQAGIPTADRHALDVDVILAAQVLTSGVNPLECMVATSNVRHLSQFISASLWSGI